MKEICGFKYRLIRQRRSNIRITASRGGYITIYAPPGVALKVIAPIIERNKHKLQNALKSYAASLDTELFGDPSRDAHLYYLGEPRAVRFSSEQAPNYSGGIFTLPPGLTANEYRRLIAKLYHRLAMEYITPLTEELSRRAGVTYERLRFTSATSRWGSCSSRKTVCFSSYLMIAPPECIKLVICHELTHLKEMNHSARFYLKLSELVPEHRELRERLKKDYAKLLRSFKMTAET